MRLIQLTLALMASLPLGGDGPFQDLGFEAALEQAQASERLVFIDFYTEWCGPCKRMDRETWQDARVVQWLTNKTVAIKLDADIETELRDRYRVTGYPTLLLLDSRGYEKGRMLGYRNGQDFLSGCKDALHSSRAAKDLQLQVKAAPQDPRLKLQLAKLLMKQSDHEQATDLLLSIADFTGAPGLEALSEPELVDAFSQLKNSSRYLGRAREEVDLRWQISRLTLLGEKSTARALQVLLAIDEAFNKPVETLAVFDEVIQAWPWGASNPHATSNAEPHASDVNTDKPKREKSSGAEPSTVTFDPRPGLFQRVVSELARRKRYPEVLLGFGDPMLWLETQRLQRTAELKRLGAESPATGGAVDPELEAARQDSMRRLKREVGVLYQALLGTPGKDGVAKELGESLLDLDPSVGTWKVLMRNARTAGRKDIRSELYATGMKVLPRAERSKLSAR